MTVNWGTVLEVGVTLIALGVFMLGAYEALAILNTHIMFTRNIPLITDIVRPWIQRHPIIGVTIASILVFVVAWFVLHFFFRP